MFDGRGSTGEGPSNSGFTASSGSGRASGQQSPASQGPKFDIIQWYPQYQSCLRYFVEVSQHSYACQALAAFINIKLPFQRAGFQPTSSPTRPNPPPIFRPGYPTSASPQQQSQQLSSYGWVSLHPYIRRLVASGFDVPAILHGWFGDDWVNGIGPLHEQERRNYLFAAKSGGWAAVKRDYDHVVEEAIPYLKPLSRVDDGEIQAAEGTWSRWLAMEDWMLGNRAPVPDEADTMST
ncbi:hypothetical protein EDC01DRAFT_618586 [Geopyxis carbonaria]|nr:hypothetical protein EDC01DRAFT_618586 [Geopyxis carbonaria]